MVVGAIGPPMAAVTLAVSFMPSAPGSGVNDSKVYVTSPTLRLSPGAIQTPSDAPASAPIFSCGEMYTS